VKMLD